MRRRWTVGTLITALGVGAAIGVGPAAAKGAGGPPANGVAPATATVTGAPGTDGSILRYAVLPGAETTLLAIETHGGAIRQQRSISGRWAFPAVTLRRDAGGLSGDGRRLVLTQPNYGFRDSRFRVFEGRSLRPVDEVVLDGRYAFDAISPDGRVMYLIEYPRRNDFLSYRVRAYDFAEGTLRPGPIVDPDEAGEPMTGIPYSREMSPDGRWAYTFYGGGEETFVHALDTVAGTAVCIDLPQFEHANLRRFDLAVDDESGAIDLLDRGEPAAVIDPATFAVESPVKSATAAGSEPDWLAWTLIAAGVGLCIGVFAIQRRWRRDHTVEAGAG